MDSVHFHCGKEGYPCCPRLRYCIFTLVDQSLGEADPYLLAIFLSIGNLILVILIFETLHSVYFFCVHDLQLPLGQQSLHLSQLIPQLLVGCLLNVGANSACKGRLCKLFVLIEDLHTDFRYIPLDEGIFGFYFESFFINNIN
jgi:hypothetical protein